MGLDTRPNAIDPWQYGMFARSPLLSQSPVPRISPILSVQSPGPWTTPINTASPFMSVNVKGPMSRK